MSTTHEEPKATFGGRLVLPGMCRPWEACSTDDTRPALTHGYLRRRDDDVWLLTTDSYIACALNVGTFVETGLVEGWVPGPALRAMQVAVEDYEGRWRAFKAVQFSTTAWRVPDGRGCAATFGLGTVPDSFPDFEKLGMWDESDGEPLDRIGLNPVLSGRLARALGVDEHEGLHLTFAGPRSAVRVTGPEHKDARRGLQMPVRPL